MDGTQFDTLAKRLSTTPLTRGRSCAVWPPALLPSSG